MDSSFVYQTIANDLRNDISLGKYGPDEMIPSENTLAARYKTSRVTVRKALLVLENEGLIRPQHGKGYFVLSPEYSRFQFDFIDKPEKGGMRYLEINVTPAGKDLAERLRTQEDTMLIMIRRLLSEDGLPSAYDEQYFLYVKGEPLIEREIHFAEFPDVFTDKYVPRKLWTGMEISVGPAPGRAASALGCTPDEKLLVVTRTVYTDEDTPVGFAQRWFAPHAGVIRAYA